MRLRQKRLLVCRKWPCIPGAPVILKCCFLVSAFISLAIFPVVSVESDAMAKDAGFMEPGEHPHVMVVAATSTSAAALTPVTTGCINDRDCDGIPDKIELELLNTNPDFKTLFVRPKTETGLNTYQYWDCFAKLLPLAPFANASIEIVVIGDNSTDYAPEYPPMRDFNYNPATDPKHPPCDIMEIVNKGPKSYANSVYNHNYGHSYFDYDRLCWSWDTKGITKSSPVSMEYRIPWVYPRALDYYFMEGAYKDLLVGTGPSKKIPPCRDPTLPTVSTLKQCWDYSAPKRSPLNMGLPGDNTTVQFNKFMFDQNAVITKYPVITFAPARDVDYDKDTVLKRTLVHEMGHAILYGLNTDHCTHPKCIMYEGTLDWELYEFGAPITEGGCTHNPGKPLDIRSRIHNHVH